MLYGVKIYFDISYHLLLYLDPKKNTNQAVLCLIGKVEYVYLATSVAS